MTENAAPARAGTVGWTDLAAGVLPSEGYVAALERLAGLLVEPVTPERHLDRLLEVTSTAMSGAGHVGLMLLDDAGRHLAPSNTPPLVGELDACQYALDEGPCLDSVRTGREHHVPALEDDERWPRFRRRAARLGVTGLASVPLDAGDATLGSLNLFAVGKRLDERDVDTARRLAGPAATTLANAWAYRRTRQLADQLHQALESRAVIERAKGLLMAEHGCTADDAFDLLRSVSQRSNRKVQEVAARVVARAEAVARADGERPG